MRWGKWGRISCWSGLMVPLLLVASLPVDAGEDDDISAAARSIAAAARREGITTILVVVRQGAGAESDPDAATILAATRAELAASLEKQKVETSDSAQVDALAAEIRSSETPGPDDVWRFQKLTDFDAALIVEYRRQNRQRRLRLELLNVQESLWTGSIRLPNLGADIRRTSRLAAAAAGGSSPATRPAANQNGSNSGGAGVQSQTTGTGSGTTLLANTPQQTATGAPSPTRPAAANSGGSQNGGQTAGGAASQTGGGNSGQGTTTAPTALNQAVLQFAVANLDRQVGNGECWTLADQALRFAGARPAIGYTFGQRIPLNAVAPGDILQFTSVRIDFPNGGYYLFGQPNHTAIVQSVNGTTVGILHQNVNGVKKVMPFTFDLGNVTAGTIEAFRPVSR